MKLAEQLMNIVYNIGIMMLEITSGIPFQEKELKELLDDVKGTLEIRDIVEELLNEKPDNRPTATECSERLRKILSDEFNDDASTISNVVEELNSAMQSMATSDVFSSSYMTFSTEHLGEVQMRRQPGDFTSDRKEL